MKKNIRLLPLIIAALLLASCSNKMIFDEKVLFPDANWAFEYKEIVFDVPIKDISKPCSVVLELDLIGTPNVEKFQITITIITPSGGELIRNVMFNFNNPKEPFIQGATKNEKIYRLIAYPKRYFSETGTYTFKVDQYSHKADNYGIRSLRMYIEKLKEE